MEEQKILEKSRVLHKLIQRATLDAIEITYTAQCLQELLGCNIYIVGQNSQLLGNGEEKNTQLFSLQEIEEGKISEENMNWIFAQNKGQINLCRDNCYCNLIPIVNQNERLGMLICSQPDNPLDENLLVLAEYGATLAAVQIIRAMNLKAETEARKKNVVQLALEVLSYSELEAVKYIFNEIEGSEGFLVASKLAEEYKLTRSVIVNALRKLESAGVIDARSLGMKGTYIKILNDYLYEELAAI